MNEPMIIEMTLEERQERNYWQKRAELLRGRARASVVRGQVTKAYSILEDIRFDFLGDTAFREKIVKAKKGCEGAINDFLLSDLYWEQRIKKHQKLTPKEYADELVNQSEPTKSSA